MTPLEIALTRILKEANSKYDDKNPFRVDYVIRELKAEVMRDPGILADLGIHREDIV